jgi:ribonuclease HII
VISRFHYERLVFGTGARCLAGVDEAGRGPLAGPVVAAAVILPESWVLRRLPSGLRGLNDSKKLTPEQRNVFYDQLAHCPELRYGIGIVDSIEIDRINILQATHAAMVAALRQLDPPPHHVLVDGLRVSAITFPQTSIIGGDGLSYSIAAASVLAKVTRDRLMVAYDQEWPRYGFAAHKGYGTPEHRERLAEHGPCPIHRRSFFPVYQVQMDLGLGA